ncbi:MAG: hypothetical protein ACYC0C_07390 [Devosia sp.]
MKLFLAVGQKPDIFDPAVELAFPDDSRHLGPGQWLIAVDGLTTKEIADKVGASSGEKGRMFISALGSYWGWHETDLWEWIEARKNKVG